MPSALLFAFLLLLYLASIGFGLLFPHTATALLVPILLLWFFAIINRNNRTIYWICLFVLFFLAGLFITGWEKRVSVREYLENKNEITGIISKDPAIKGKYQYLTVKIKGQNLFLEATTEQFPKFNIGDKVVISGKFKIAEEKEINQNIIGSSYLPKIKETEYKDKTITELFFTARTQLTRIKNELEKRANYLLPQPSSSLINGILFGTRSEIPTELLSWLTVTGTVHIIALSGYNITIIIEFFRILTRKLSRHLVLFITFTGIIMFVFATGLSASIIRAAIMGVVAMLGKHFGRQNSSLTAVLLTASIMVTVNPSIILFDIGFQLSFAAILGIILFSPSINKRLDFLGKTTGELLGTTLAANIATWPIISFYFGRVSLISPIANLMILPLISPLMLFGFFAIIISYYSLWLGKLLSFIPWVIIKYITETVSYLGKLKISDFSLKFTSPLLLLGYYLLLFDIFLILEKPFGRKQIN